MQSEVTLILARIASGERQATVELWPLVYDELRRMANVRMQQEAASRTLQPTALVNEAWLRLGADAQPQWNSRAHFFAAAAEAMRRILTDRARRRLAVKRGGGAQHVDIDLLDPMEIPIPISDDERLIALSDALQKFSDHEPRKAELVKLRYFVGLSFKEAASALGIAVSTAKQWWAYSRAWLSVELRSDSIDTV